MAKLLTTMMMMHQFSRKNSDLTWNGILDSLVNDQQALGPLCGWKLGCWRRGKLPGGLLHDMQLRFDTEITQPPPQQQHPIRLPSSSLVSSKSTVSPKGQRLCQSRMLKLRSRCRLLPANPCRYPGPPSWSTRSLTLPRFVLRSPIYPILEASPRLRPCRLATDPGSQAPRT